MPIVHLPFSDQEIEIVRRRVRRGRDLELALRIESHCGNLNIFIRGQLLVLSESEGAGKCEQTKRQRFHNGRIKPISQLLSMIRQRSTRPTQPVRARLLLAHQALDFGPVARRFHYLTMAPNSQPRRLFARHTACRRGGSLPQDRVSADGPAGRGEAQLYAVATLEQPRRFHPFRPGRQRLRRTAPAQRLDLLKERRIGAQRREILEEQREIALFTENFPRKVFDPPVTIQKLRGCSRTDARYAWVPVGRIAYKCEQVRNKWRADAEFFAYRRGIANDLAPAIDLHNARTAHALR